MLDDGRGDVAALGGDVSLLAEPGAEPGADGNGEPGAAGDRPGPAGSALLRVGDDPAALRIAGPDVPRAALAAAEAFLTAAAASGSGAWRVRELPDGHGLTARDVAAALRSAGIGAAYVPEAPAPGTRTSPPYADSPPPASSRAPTATVRSRSSHRWAGCRRPSGGC